MINMNPVAFTPVNAGAGSTGMLDTLGNSNLFYRRHAAATCVVLCAVVSSAAYAQIDIRTFPTYGNISVNVLFAGAPANGTAVTMQYKLAGSPDAFVQAHPLSRITTTNFAGSLMWLKQDTAYTIMLSSGAFASNMYATCSTRPDKLPAPSGTIYHVALTGNDANTGLTSNQAFRTVGRGIAVATSGSTILVYSGRYHEGDLTFPRAGTATQPIVLSNAPNAKPVLDGTDTNWFPSWNLYDEGTATYRSLCASIPDNAYLNGGQFFHYTNMPSLTLDPFEQGSGYYHTNGYMYVRLPGGGNPATNTITISRFTTALTADGKACIHIIGLEICYYGAKPNHRGIYLRHSDSNVVANCYIHHVGGPAIGIKGDSFHNLIQNCSFSEWPMATWSWQAVKDNGDYPYETGGVLVYGDAKPCRGTVIRGCTFSNMFDGSELYSLIAAGPTMDMDVYNNYFTLCADDCIETDAYGSNVRIYDNVFYDFTTGISVAPAYIGPTYLVRNLLGPSPTYAALAGPDSETRNPIKFNVTDSRGTQWIYIYHNTAYSDLPMQDAFVIWQYCGWTNVIGRNNIYAGGRYAFYSSDAFCPIDFDYDLLYNTNVLWFGRWQNVRYDTYTLWKNASRQESHSVYAAPAFVDAAGGDYHLTALSPAIDKGIVIPGFNDGYFGTAPDMGAFEFSAGTPCRVVVTGTNFIGQWSPLSGPTHRLQYTTNLVTPSWTNTGAVLTSANGVVSFTNNMGTDAVRVYRLIRWP